MNNQDAANRSRSRSRPKPSRPRSSPQAPAVRPNAERVYVATSDLELGEIQPHQPGFFETINKVQALTCVGERLPAARGSLKEQRGYARDDLFAIAEVAYHYLFNGGVKLAVTLYEGLTAVEPNEPYFAMGLALSYDRFGSKLEAMRWYKRASDLDPSDGRADVNRAELYIEEGDFARAKTLLMRGAAKATNRGDAPLANKATAMINHISRNVRR